MKSSKGSRAAPSRTSQKRPPKDETELNKQLREAMRADGLKVTHLRETDLPGATDLLIWDGSHILGWMELKMAGEAIRPSQKEFMDERLRESGRVYVARLVPDSGELQVFRWPSHRFGPDKPLAGIKDFKTYPLRDNLLEWSGHFID